MIDVGRIHWGVEVHGANASLIAHGEATTQRAVCHPLAGTSHGKLIWAERTPRAVVAVVKWTQPNLANILLQMSPAVIA